MPLKNGIFIGPRGLFDVYVEEGSVVNLSKKSGNYQWSGIVKIKVDKLKGTSSHVYDILNEVLPLPAFNMRTREINTPEDYDRAIEWFENGMLD